MDFNGFFKDTIHITTDDPMDVVTNPVPKAYKHFDEIDKFLANLFKFFPSLYGTAQIMNDKFGEIVITPILNHSREFCSLKENGFITITEVGQGGVGTISNFVINEEQPGQMVYGIIVSIKLIGGFEPFYIPVMIKRTAFPREKSTVETVNGVREWRINDPTTELIFGSMISHLYDLGVGIFFCKYLSTYICKNPKEAAAGRVEHRSSQQLFTVVEKSSIEMKQMLTRRNTPWFQNIHTNPDIFLNIIFQFVYAIYIGKKNFGLTHFDCHHRNVMITNTDKSTIIDGNPHIPYVYHGKNLLNTDYILINVGNKEWLAMKYTGLITKIIDFGLAGVYLNHSQNPKYKRNLIIATKPGSVFSEAAYTTCKTDSSFRNTIEIQFLLTNMYEHMRLGLDTHAGQTTQGDPKAPGAFKPLMDMLNNFTRNFYGSEAYMLETVLRRDKTKRIRQKLNGQMDWISRNYNCGLSIPSFNDPSELLQGLKRVCIARDHIRSNFTLQHPGQRQPETNCTIYWLETDIDVDNLTINNCLFLPLNENNKLNSLDPFIKSMNKIKNSCEPNSRGTDIFQLGESQNEQNRKYKCAQEIDLSRMWDPERTTSKKLYSTISNTAAYDAKTKTINNRILTAKNYPNSQLTHDSTNSISIFNIEINPSALQLDNNQQGSLIYSNTQNWMDFNNIALGSDELQKRIEIVHLNAIIINPKTTYNVELNHGLNLWEASKVARRGGPTSLSINGGYYIVPQLLVDPLLTEREEKLGVDDTTVHFLTSEDVDTRKPIGFHYDHNNVAKQTNGTYLSIPKPYRTRFGVVWCGLDNIIHIESHETFLSWHVTVEQPILYELSNNTMSVELQTVIQMENNKIIGGKPKMKRGGDPFYKWAFCCGPMLVDNGHVVFNTIALDSTFTAIGSNKQPVAYKITHDVTDNNKFKVAASGEAPDYYGTRASNRFHVHNVMGIDRQGRLIFFLIEGRGFDAPGLVRVQVAYLVNKFNIIKAISLDGGFSANGVYRFDEGPRKFVQNDPTKRQLGISMNFMFRPPVLTEPPIANGPIGAIANGAFDDEP